MTKKKHEIKWRKKMLRERIQKKNERTATRIAQQVERSQRINPTARATYDDNLLNTLHYIFYILPLNRIQIQSACTEISDSCHILFVRCYSSSSSSSIRNFICMSWTSHRLMPSIGECGCKVADTRPQRAHIPPQQQQKTAHRWEFDSVYVIAGVCVYICGL